MQDIQSSILRKSHPNTTSNKSPIKKLTMRRSRKDKVGQEDGVIPGSHMRISFLWARRLMGLV